MRGQLLAPGERFAVGRRNNDRYVYVKAPTHPRSGYRGRVAEHILIAERALGRFLAKAHPVHHVDGSHANNANANLVICEDDAYHNLLHMRQAALNACGNANWRKCVFCGQHDDPTRMVRHTKTTVCHRECRRAYWTARRVEAA